MSKPSTVQRLAAWIVELSGDDFSEAQLAQARLLALDTIGCGLAGWAEPMARDCVAAAIDEGAAPRCQIIGSRQRTSIANATFANGALVRVLDLNDYLIGDAAGGGDMGGHPSDNIPVALAAGEHALSRGRDVLAAIVLGYELYGRLKTLIDRHGAWDGISVSAVVAAGITGRLIGLDRTGMAHALALALVRCATPAGVRSGHLSAAKSIANALVAQTGVQAALLAARGITGPLGLIDEPHGLQQVFERTDGFARLTEPLARDACIMSAHVKAYPCLATGQGIVAAALDMHHLLGGDAGRLADARVVLADHPTVLRQQRDPGRLDPRSRESADHSFPFLAAVALIDGELGLAQFADERWHDRRVRAVMARLAFANDPALGKAVPDAYPCRIEATTTDGRLLVARCTYPPGFSRGGSAAEAVIAKFNAVTAPHLASAARQAIIDAVMGLEDCADLGGLAAAIAVPVT